ncbi:MAG: hypothetical protein IKU32_04080 [Clostridia bacterium]|nr:hypothetical protein [Clostridia bacterium]
MTAEIDRDWNAYSSVVSNQRGKLTVEGGTIEHLGGTDMAYGIDNLTNGKDTYAETVINGGTVKSTYRAIRQFLNGAGTAQNILTVNGGTIEGANKSIWMQDPSANANTGTLTVSEDATLKGDVYLFVTAGSAEWPVSVSIDADALDGESTVVTGNVPDGSQVKETEGYWGIVDDDSVSVTKGMGYPTVDEAIDAAEAGDTITLLADADVSSVNTTKNLTIVDENGVKYSLMNGYKVYPSELNFDSEQAGYSGVAAQTVTIEGVGTKPTVTVNSSDYVIGEVQGDNGKYTFTVQPKDGLSAGNHDASLTVTIDQASPSADLNVGTIEAKFTVTAKPSSGSSISVTYNGGNSFSTSKSDVPTSVEIDGVPVTFNGNGSNFTVGCINPGAKWIKVSWNSTTVTTNFTPDGLVECANIGIPKTGDMPIWAAVAAFFGF